MNQEDASLCKAVNRLIISAFMVRPVENLMANYELGFRIKYILKEQQEKTRDRCLIAILFDGPLDIFGTERACDRCVSIATSIYSQLGRYFGWFEHPPPNCRGTMAMLHPASADISVSLLNCNDKVDSEAKKWIDGWGSCSSIHFTFTSKVDGKNECTQRLFWIAPE